MCGILGQFAWGSARTDDATLLRLLDGLSYRGPDGEGRFSAPGFFLGHRRLAVIDLETGAQPMESDGLAVTFNGEIYNFPELREELSRAGFAFRTRSDTEVLLHGYRAWGTELPMRLRGMFAFAIADVRANELYLARDPFGEKPLFLREGAGTVFFASEARPLLQLAPNELNPRALARFLCLNYVPGVDTLAAAVKRLAPGTWRRYGAGGLLEEKRYWQAPSGELPLPGAPLEEFRSLFDRSVAVSLRSDVPVGILLSGGIDSSLVAESAARQGKITRAYCLDFLDAGFSEAEQAEAVARRLGIPLERVPFDSRCLETAIDVLRHASDPLADSSMLPFWALARAAAKGHKVVLSGDGGDELFAGYLTYRASGLHAQVSSLPSFARRALASVRPPVFEGKVTRSYQLRRFLRASNLPTREAHFTWNGSWLPAEAFQLAALPALRGELESVLALLADETGLPAHPSLSDLQRADLSAYLPGDILTKADRMSMAHGLEVRAPFLDPAIARFALSLPEDRRLGKALLRDASERIYGRAQARARKQGFSVPIHAWLRGPGRGLVEHWLSPSSLSGMGFLHARAVRARVDAFLAGEPLGFEVWGLVVLSQWCGEHL